MITLDQLLMDSGINRHTLAKYRGLGLIPEPQIIHWGNKKKGQPRGNEALYPEYTPWLIHEIRRLKEKPYRYTLGQIREAIGKIEIEDITPKEEISEPIEADYLNALIRTYPHLDQETAGYERIVIEYEIDEKNGKLRVAHVWGTRKGREGPKG